MPNPATSTTVTASPSSTNWLDNTPNGDTPFSELFGDPSSEASTVNGGEATIASTTTQTNAEPQTQTFTEIKTSTGSVYRTLDAVTKGIEDKDTLITQLRDQLKSVTGRDPIRPHVEPENTNYIGNPTRFADDLAEAARKGDAAKYQQVLLKQFDEYLGPAKPLFQEFARSNAQGKVSAEIKDFDQFVHGEEYQKTLERNPVLSNAIQGAEQNFAYSSQLPELYRLAYDSYTRARLPELIRAAAQNPVASGAATTQQPVRTTTMSGSTMTPAAPSNQQTVREMMTTSQGRKDFIKQFETSNGQNVDWSQVRW